MFRQQKDSRYMQNILQAVEKQFAQDSTSIPQEVRKPGQTFEDIRPIQKAKGHTCIENEVYTTCANLLLRFNRSLATSIMRPTTMNQDISKILETQAPRWIKDVRRLQDIIPLIVTGGY